MVITAGGDPLGMHRRGSFLVRAGGLVVEGWSAARLAFEPRGWQIEYRAALRRALAELPATAGLILDGYYAAADTGELSDAENVLFYNVGSRWYRHLADAGVGFRRGFAVPLAPDGADYGHYVRYRLREPRTDEVAGDGEAAFGPVRLDRLDKPGPIWAAIRRQAAPPPAHGRLDGWFGVTLTLGAPTGHTSAVADKVKPLLDGVICAFHVHRDPGDLDAVVERLSVVGLGKPDELAGMVTDDRWNLLGSVRLVKPFGARPVSSGTPLTIDASRRRSCSPCRPRTSG